MPSGFPNSIDNFTNPLASSPLNSPSHAGQHQDLNDAVNKIETYMGLVFVKSQTIGTAVSSVTVTDAFSSTYDNYKILISGGAGSQSVELNMRLGATVTNYHFNFVFTAWNATVAADGSKVATSFQYVGGMSANGIIADIDVMSPNLAKTSRISAFAAGQEVAYAGTAIGGLFNTTQYTDFTILAAAGNMTGGTIRVYGYRN